MTSIIEIGMMQQKIAELERQNRHLANLVRDYEAREWNDASDVDPDALEAARAFWAGEEPDDTSDVDPDALEAARRFWNGEDDFNVHPETVRRVHGDFNYEERTVFGKEVKR